MIEDYRILPGRNVLSLPSVVSMAGEGFVDVWSVAKTCGGPERDRTGLRVLDGKNSQIHLQMHRRHYKQCARNSEHAVDARLTGAQRTGTGRIVISFNLTH